LLKLLKYFINSELNISSTLVEDSMDTIKQLAAYGTEVGSDIRFMGVPKTIDNDLAVTDHTPGFGSAAKYIGATLKEVIRDALVYDTKKYYRC
jgi:6-phosphofructokinase 1